MPDTTSRTLELVREAEILRAGRIVSMLIPQIDGVAAAATRIGSSDLELKIQAMRRCLADVALELGLREDDARPDWGLEVPTGD